MADSDTSAEIDQAIAEFVKKLETSTDFRKDLPFMLENLKSRLEKATTLENKYKKLKEELETVEEALKDARNDTQGLQEDNDDLQEDNDGLKRRLKDSEQNFINLNEDFIEVLSELISIPDLKLKSIIRSLKERLQMNHFCPRDLKQHLLFARIEIQNQ